MRQNNTNVAHQDGFTLIELLTVIAIIGILAGFLVPAVNKARFQGRLAATKANVRAVADACDVYASTNGTYPPMGNDWIRMPADGAAGLGGSTTEPGRFVSGNFVFFSSEDIGNDGIGPYFWNGTTWLPSILANAAEPNYPGVYPGPDADGTEGNNRLDANEDRGLDLVAASSDADGTEGNGRLDGTVYDRLGGDIVNGVQDEWAETGQLLHYYAGLKNGPLEDTTLDALQFAQPSYTACVVFSVAPDEGKGGLNNFYTTVQRVNDPDPTVDLRGTDDNMAGDPYDGDGDGVVIERTTGEGRLNTIGEQVYQYDVRIANGLEADNNNFALPGSAVGAFDSADDGVIMVIRGL